MAADAAATAPPPARGLAARPWWPAAKRALTIGIVLLVLGLIAEQARTVDWPSVLRAIRAYPAATLMAAAGLAAASHAIYCTYDLIGRHQTGHALRTPQVVCVGFISYAFNLNLGSIVGSIAMRYRLYSRRGLAVDVITQVLVLSLVTNWLGYLCVGGSVFLLAPVSLPPDWKIGSEGLRIVGGAALLLAAGYVAMCFASKRREWRVRGHEVRLPSGRTALLQVVLSSLNWLVIASVVYVLLQQKVDYASVLCVLLLAAVAGIITHVPAGLGVLEAVFVALLSHRVPQGELLAALLAYRAIYYLAPLAFAGLLFFVVDLGPGGVKAAPIKSANPKASTSASPR